MKPIHPLDPIGPLDLIRPLDPMEPLQPLDAMLPRKYWIPFNTDHTDPLEPIKLLCTDSNDVTRYNRTLGIRNS